MGVSKNNGTPKSSILIGFSIIGTTIFGNTRILFPVLEIVSGNFFWGEDGTALSQVRNLRDSKKSPIFPGESC